MIVRRIREHFAHHNWFAVWVDLAIVVIGVFLGLQTSNWNQARVDRATGRDYRQRIVADMRANEIDLLDRQSYYRVVRAHALATLAALDRPAAAAGEQFLIDAYQASQISTRRQKRFTYDEAISTGHVDMLGDPAQREQIANYYVNLDTVGATLDFVSPYREYLRTGMPSAIQQRVRSRCAEKLDFMPDGTIFGRLPAKCALGLDPATITAGVATVRALPELRADLARLIADHEVKIVLIDALIGRERTLRKQIAAMG